MSIQLYDQCLGPNDCAAGLVCQKQNGFYSQCLSDSNNIIPTATVARVRKCHPKIDTLTPISDSISPAIETPPGLQNYNDNASGSKKSRNRSKTISSATKKRTNTKSTRKSSAPSSTSSSQGSPTQSLESKESASSTSDPSSQTTSPASNNAGSSSALVTKGPVMQGKTTRYWDCCKPSCADPANTGAVTKPVGSCQKDGAAPAGLNDGSGCAGGNAYTCNSNQPFISVNSTMAYGFAAASIQGMQEKDRCCACFKLDFTSGGAQGKSMIVQVTNSGGDLGFNQFDIQIPGGGVGLFNACTNQWNAPAPDAWGGKYGGVGSDGECSQLPSQLQPGCKFRFGDFFKGSDNPSINFQRVTCPVELTDKTGCKRMDD